jgi:ankyrin repeat protein
MQKLGARPDLFCAAGMGDLDTVRACFDDQGALRPGASRTGSSRFARDGSRLPCPPATAREQITDALVVACRNAHPDVVRELLRHDPDLTFGAFMGGAALHWAHYGGSPEVIAMIEAAGADRDSRDNALGCTPRAFGICAPASWGLVGVVRARLDADPSLARYTDGHTSALHEAAREGSVGVVQLLLERGADPGMKNGDGRTAAELAAEGGHTEVVALLAPGQA